jgi:hypothetical protein
LISFREKDELWLLQGFDEKEHKGGTQAYTNLLSI